MASNKIQFRSIEELKDQSLNAKLAKKEFASEIPVDEFLGRTDQTDSATNRRDFLKLLGFSTAAVTLAACEAPVIKTIPYVVKPHSIIPGVANYYASTLFDGYDFASVLVKTREGRPIKIEPNKLANELGTTNARVQASVLSLYDNDKLKKPMLDGKESSFDKVDGYLINGINAAQASGKKIVVLSHSFPSPTFKKLFGEFKTKYPNAELVTYDAITYNAGLDAAQEVFGVRALPVYDLSTTELVVSFQADFLNDFNASNLEVSYAKARTPGAKMLKHIQVESNLSQTGANADKRIQLKPSAANALLVELYNAINGSSADKNANALAKELLAKASKAVVLADSSKASQVLAHLINQKLGSEALVKTKFNLLKEYDNTKFNEFLVWLNSGQVGVLISNNVNPIYSHAKGEDLQKQIEKIECSVAITFKEDEMAKSSKALIPATHWLEAWGDITPQSGAVSFIQPTIQKVYESRQLEDSLLVWINGSKSPANNYYDYLKATWATGLPESFNKALYNGYNTIASTTNVAYAGGNAGQAIAELKSFKASELELVLNTKISIGDGTQANNPWLQELPDPITRLSWDNYLSISPEDATKLGIENNLNGRMELDGSLVNLTVNGKTIKNIPVYIQFGQASGSLGLALGYGKALSGKVAQTGVNAYPLFDGKNLCVSSIKIEKTDEDHEFAGIQFQNTLMGRYEIAKEVSLQDYLNKDVNEWNKPLSMATYSGELPINKVDLWDQFDDTDGHHFNLSVDMNSCTGCGACVIACQAENNVAVVGKEEIRRSRDMYWLRIDRYYTAREKIEVKEALDRGLDVPHLYDILDDVHHNPDVIFQPVMCQHCNHAPCETVCPVAATSHGKQGQNQMAYNRCVGTRYCANNCPYKVRRFNWFNYALNDKYDFNMNNDLGRMVLNPDVVVRTRGVMEKCSMCIQMTQKTISEAKNEQSLIKDGDFQTACSKVCSTGALKFGDMNDKSSEVRALFNDKRKYLLLEEIGTKPNVFYHTKVRNRVEEENN